MAIKNRSIAIKGPEFLNLAASAVNPLMSKCDIKVLYTGHNRNGSDIQKEVAEQMATTLRGSPIVGYFRSDKGDFGDHGHQMVIDMDGVQEKVLTIPYGFVATDAKVWFQWFEDTDSFGNAVEREYLMTEGYIWNGQFSEADKILKEGQPQSMEIADVDGHWATDSKLGKEFFIITDAVFTKLCILGDEVEPCFEGASIKIANTYSLVEEEEDVKVQIINMFKELQFTLEGGQITMDNEMKATVETPENADTSLENTADAQFAEESESGTSPEPEVTEPEVSAENNDDTFASKEEEDKEDKKTSDEPEAKEEEPEEEPKKEHSLVVEKVEDSEEYKSLEASYQQLQQDFAALTEKCNSLQEFYDTAMMAQKDALIEKFYMLSDEDKQDVIAHKAEYSLDDIESKLSVICFRKKVNFDLEDNAENDINIETNSAMFTINTDETDTTPEWIKAVDARTKY